ncbi:MAG: NADH-quinone oxidoreductase subunit NuoF [Planctomycetota bacterium]
MSREIYLTSRMQNQDSHTLREYESHDGYQGLRKALGMAPEAVTEEVKSSGLRGRGGAGFPTGVKWTFMPKDASRPKYLVVNADESEPGTFKDRLILEKDPHGVVEGMVIAAYAMGASHIWIYIRGEYWRPYQILTAAIAEARAANYLGQNVLGSSFSVAVTVTRGAGAYICGEETAQMESLEGKRGHPRPKPPFPANFGVFGNPTTVNNVETLANVPWIVRKGAAWFKSMGTEKSAGNAIFGVSGHVQRPGLFELPLGVSVKELIHEHAGGMQDAKPLKAFIPGGSSTGFLPASLIDVKMDHDSLAKVGSMLGTGGLIVMNEETCIVAATHNLARFYHHETCGQCVNCREACDWTDRILHRIEDGHGRPEDLETFDRIALESRGKTICVFPDALAIPTLSALKHFRQEFEDHIRLQACPFRQATVMSS